MTSPASGSTVAVAPIYMLVTGTAADGSPIPVEGQHNIVDVVPGEDGYSDLWEVMLVTVEPGYEADSIRSKADIDAAGLDVAAAGLIVNCPIVPAGSTFEDGEPLVQGWYRGERVFYPDFGENLPVAIPIWAFATGVSADGTPMLVEGQHNIIDSVPGMPGYSAFWRVMLVMVDEMYAADSVRSATEVAASRLRGDHDRHGRELPGGQPHYLTGAHKGSGCTNDSYTVAHCRCADRRGATHAGGSSPRGRRRGHDR